MSSRVSVIMAVKNGELYFAQALESVMAQTAPPFEILVIDGRSTDRTAAIAQRFPVKYLVQHDDGLANARNLGIRFARGEFIAFLDSDDEWAPAKLELQLRAMDADPTLQYTTTLMQFRMEPDSTFRAGEREALKEPRAGLTPGALVTRRALFEEIGGFDPAYLIGGDSDWFARARDLTIPTFLVPQVLLYKRLHATNLSTNIAQNRHDMFRLAKQSIARQRRALP